MKIELILLGKTKEDYVVKGIQDFSSRLGRFTTVHLNYVKVKKQVGKSDEEMKLYESSLLDNNIGEGAYRVALDLAGRQFSSESFAEVLTGLEQKGVKKTCFVLGGPVGLADEQLKRADLILSLSKMTFTHDMARLLLLEQLYRAYSIKAGTRYHK